MATTTGGSTNPAIATVTMTSPDSVQNTVGISLRLDFAGNPNDAFWRNLRDSQGANPTTFKVQFVADPMGPGPVTNVDLGTAQGNIVPGTDTYSATRFVPATTLPVGVYELTAILTLFTGPAATLVLVSGVAGFVGDAIIVVFQ